MVGLSMCELILEALLASTLKAHPCNAGRDSKNKMDSVKMKENMESPANQITETQLCLFDHQREATGFYAAPLHRSNLLDRLAGVVASASISNDTTEKAVSASSRVASIGTAASAFLEYALGEVAVSAPLVIRPEALPSA